VKYAVVRLGGNQYKISEGEKLEVDLMPGKAGDEIDLPEVLLVVEDEKIEIGQPLVKDIPVKAKIVSHLRGEKIRVSRFHAKARSRKVRGFRAELTQLEILSIGKKAVKEEKVPVKKVIAKKVPVKKVAKKA
jgi:large subunit ribosomal protein L21